MTSRAHLLSLLAMVFLLSSCSWVDDGVGGNIPPRSADDAFTVKEGGTLEILTFETGVLGNDEDGGNRPLVARVVENSGPTYAASAGFTFNPDGTFTYIHNGDEPPSAVTLNDKTVRHCDFFSYIANDGIEDGEPKNVCIDIIPVNDVPIIIGQKTLAIVEDNPVTITPADLDINDPDNSPDDFRIEIKSSDYYQVEQNTVHPNENYNGPLTVELTVSDGVAESKIFPFQISVTPDNDAPVITQKGPLSTLEDTPLRIDRDQHLTIKDIDNVPEDFTLTVESVDGGNYSVAPDQVTIIPKGNYSGPLEVKIILTDEGQINGKTLNIDVIAVNDAPVIAGQVAVNTPEDTPLEIAFNHLTVIDPDNEYPAGFTLTVQDGMNYTHNGNTITPDQDFNGELSVPVVVNDGELNSEVFELKVIISPVNDAPTISGTPATSVNEDIPYSFVPTASDIDLGDTLTFSIANKPGWANFDSATGALSGTPTNADVGTTPGVVITVTDSAVPPASVSLPPFDLTVTNVNDPPVAVADSASTTEDTPVITGNVLANDTDPDGDTLSISAADTASAQGGTVVNNNNGTFTYTPAANFSGSDSFGYTVSDGNGGTANGTVTITVTAQNDPPVALGDTASTTEDTPVTTGNVLANDTDPDGDTLSVSAADTASAQGGTVVNNNNGTFTYTPAANFNGSDSFTYTVSDGNGGTANGTVTITVTAQNDPPVAVADTASTTEDTPVTTGNVLANDTDPDGDTLSVSAADTASAQGGTVVNNNNGTFTYTPPANFSGSDSFGYTVSDGQGGTANGMVTITVTAQNAPPVAVADTASTNEDTPVTTGNVLTNDTDPDNDPLSVSAADTASAQGGTVVNNNDGTFTYTPAANFNGSDSFTYTVSDGQGGTANGTVTITVTAQNDPPVAVADTASTTEDTPVTTGNVLANDTDVDGDTLSVSGADAISAQGGTVVNNNNGTFTYTPPANFSGIDSFTYTVSDGQGGTANGTVTITVTVQNDPPVAVADTASTNEDTPVTTGNVLANDTDPDGDTLAISAADTASVQGGTVVNNNDGTFTYTPAANFNGSDSFTYTVSDGQEGTANGTVTITVNAVNDAPVIAPGQIFNVDENLASTPVNPGPVLASDVENDTLSYAIDGSNPGNFVIDSVSGQISTSTAFDFETQPTQYTLTIKVTDSGTPSQSSTQNVTININDVDGLAASVNQPPQVSGVCRATPLNVPVLNILLSASDPDGEDSKLRFYRVTNGTKGNATVDITGRFTYTPHSDARGTDTFVYKVVDQKGAETFATAKVIIGNTRIMPLGDAITAGSTDGSNTTPGYRQALRNSLTDLGYAVEFVGSQASAPDRHEGRLGSQVTSAYVAGNVEGWLTANPADVVLLHIGSQDFASGGDVSVSDAQIGNILGAIDAWAITNGQDVIVLLARIIDQQPANLSISAFNSLVQQRAQENKVIIVDQFNALDYPGDLADNMHPNSTGYQKMAAAWRSELEKGVLDKCP